jgi:glycosyltransferase involved in cell wall biosynthesis
LATATYCLSISSLFKANETPVLFTEGMLQAVIIACRMGIPTIYEAHTKAWKRRAEHMLVKKMIRNPNFVKIVVISKSLKKLFQEKYNVPDNKIIVAPDGADPIGGSQTIKPWKGRIGCLQVGYAGSVYRGRGIGLIDKIARRMEDVDFHIIGANKRKVESHLKRIVPQNLYCHGRVPHSMIYLYLNSCDVLIAPYQSTVCIYGNEGNTADIMSPLKIFEYMACGKAIIASDMDVLHEIIGQENAMLVNSTKVDHWIKAIESMKNEEKRRVLGINAANKFLNNYTWNIRAKNIIFNNNGCC